MTLVNYMHPVHDYMLPFIMRARMRIS